MSSAGDPGPKRMNSEQAWYASATTISSLAGAFSALSKALVAGAGTLGAVSASANNLHSLKWSIVMIGSGVLAGVIGDFCSNWGSWLSKKAAEAGHAEVQANLDNHIEDCPERKTE